MRRDERRRWDWGSVGRSSRVGKSDEDEWGWWATEAVGTGEDRGTE